jgi:hypothetical protein
VTETGGSTGGGAMARLLREPLVHFGLIGASLFIAFSAISAREDAPADDEIVVTAGRIEHFAALYERTYQRPPTDAELDGLIASFVREEAAYREGVALGLDRDDTVVRRRLRQKLDFIAEDLASQVEPTDDDLAAHLAGHPDDFRLEPRVSFRHIFFDQVGRGRDLESDIEAMRMRLAADPDQDASGLGDRILLEHDYNDMPASEATLLFGGTFGQEIAGFEVGVWSGPVLSGYGAHLVRVDARQAGRLPALDEVRAAVRRDWDSARREEVIEAFYRELVGRYTVVIEARPDQAPSQEQAER